MEDLIKISREIRDLKKTIRGYKKKNEDAKAALALIEEHYKREFAFNDWKTKEGKFFEVRDFDGGIFYCNVLEVDNTGYLYEYINEEDGYFSIEKEEDLMQDCDYSKWLEILPEEYAEKKVGKISA